MKCSDLDMRLTVIGAGHLGLTHAACMANSGSCRRRGGRAATTTCAAAPTARTSAAVSGPPSPPSGPPFGTYFSRRKLSAPSPPRPATTWIRARSWNKTYSGGTIETVRRSPPKASLAMPLKRPPGFAWRPLNPLLGPVND